MTQTLHTVLCARKKLSALTPLKTDCGRLCGGACCAGDDATGMLLFPGEEALYADCSFGGVIPADFELGGKQAQLFVCRGTCPRDERPLACRLFPLFYRIQKDGAARVEIDQRARAVCPLCDFGLVGLSADFVQAAEEAYALLRADADCAAYLRALSDAFTL